MAARFGDASDNDRVNEVTQDDCARIAASKRRSTKLLQNQQQQLQQQHHAFVFKPFTRESLAEKRSRRQSNVAPKKKQSFVYTDNQIKTKLEPDPYLASGQQLPCALVRQLPNELIGRPIEDIDPYYADQETFVIISRGKELTRFSSTDALYLLGPFHPIRRVVLYILVNPIFNLLVILTILINCILMTIQGSETVEKTEIIFTIVYTTEMGLKVLARGFIVDHFTYLRDAWNWLDFAVIIMAYLTIVVQDLGNLSVIRTFRVLRALKTVAIIPGMKTIVGAVIDSIYMGNLTQKCITNGPTNMTDVEWFNWCSNSSHWVPEPDDEIFGAYRLCGNASGAQSCPSDHTCLQGFGPNPDYGFTNFDTFGWALICSFRLMTQDFWEGLYMQVLKTAGSWHILFFIVSIFLGSIYLMNLILAIVAMSYNELQRRAEEEEEAAAEDEAAFLESCRLMEIQDQMSDYSNSTFGGRSSYRPSVEIGLVGQSLLASLCQNGLLGQQMRDKVNQQMVLPEVMGASPQHQQVSPHAQLRSHSLSVHLDATNKNRTSISGQGGDSGSSKTCNNSRKNSSIIPTNYLFRRTSKSATHRSYNFPPNLATSMTELRRRSSTRTVTSIAAGSPIRESLNPQPINQQQQQQQQLKPSASSLVQHKRYVRQSSIRRPSQQSQDNQISPIKSRLSPKHHVSSGCVLGAQNNGSSQEPLDINYEGGRNSARSSIKSDRDLSILRQRAALIKIGNNLTKDGTHLEDSSKSFTDNLTEEDSSKLSVLYQPTSKRAPTHSRTSFPSNDRQKNLVRGRGSTSAISSDSHDRKQVSMKQRTKSHDYSILERNSSTGSGYFETVERQGRRKKRKQSFTILKGDKFSSEVAICDQPKSIHSKEESNCHSRPPLMSTLSGDRVGQHGFRNSVVRSLNAPSATPVITQQQQQLQHRSSISSRSKTTRFGGSTRTLHTGSPPIAMSSSETAHQLAVGSCLRPGNMNRLSVENFQQFGLSGSQHQLMHQNNSEDSSSTGPDQHTTINEFYQSQQRPQQQHQHTLSGNRVRMGSRGHILPSTMIRSSISRQRQSILGEGFPEDGANLMGAKRMSTDFTRRTSDWSRLSMSGNVDLRRLLRLWSHTNPYTQSAERPSICSYSNYSQINGQSNNNSPAHSDIYNLNNNNPSFNNSPRPSSVGSARQAYELISAMSRRRSRFREDSRYAMPLDDSDQMSVNVRDKCIAYCLSCLDILCIWECCGAWVKIQRVISLVVFDPFTELFIILCILINTLFMALDSDDADANMKSIFERGNYFFTATFAVEASMKIMALSPKFYFREGWNVFDSIIVCLSLLELGLEGVYGLSVLRSFRLLRVFKLAKSWPTLNLLISIMGKAVGDLGNLTFVLAIIVFIFAVMGMQLFGNKYVAHNFPSGELPRWNFTDFMHSFMIVFRILCAEWIEPMWDCLLVGGWPCIPFFLIAVTVGNLVVLNLFLALLLASFGASNLSSPQADNVDTKKLQEAIGRFSRFGRWTRKKLFNCLGWLMFGIFCKKPKRADNLGDQNNSTCQGCDNKRVKKSHIVAMSKLERMKNIELKTEELKNKIRRSPEHHYHLRQLAKSQLKQQLNESKQTPQGGEQQPSSIGPGYNYNYKTKLFKRAGFGDSSPVPPSIIPIIVDEATEGDEDQETSTSEQQSSDNNKTTPQVRFSLKLKINLDEEEGEINENQASIADLVLQQQQENQANKTLDDEITYEGTSTNQVSQEKSQQLNNPPTTPTFTKQSSSSGGVRHPSYFVNMQPIREDSRDADSSASQSDNDIVLNKSLDKLTQDEVQMSQKNQRKKSPQSKVEYSDAKSQEDQLLLKQHRDFRSECDVGKLKAECSQHQHQLLVDHKNDSISNESYEFETLDRGHQEYEDQEEEDDDDEDDKERPKSSLYLEAPKRQDMEEDNEKALQYIETYIEKCICLGIICLKWFLFRQYIRKIVEHRYFDQCILVLIVISSGTLALEDKHLNERPTLKRTLDVLDTIFTIIFSLEMIMKWLAFGIRRYFGNIWSWLDFVIVLVSFINLMASIFGSGKLQALKTIRTLRAMRGLRPLRALQRFQGMRVVVNALIQAIPSIFNVLLVCLIFWLIFSIMGVQMFGGKFWRCLNPETLKVVSFDEAANRHECIGRNLTWANPQINFDNVLNAYLALFQVATFKGWIDIMNSATDSRTRDDQPIREANIYMYFYFVFFVIFGSFFTLNLFIGVIIDNFNEQKKKTGGSLEIFMTDDQKKYYHAMKKMKSKRPIKAMTRPKLKVQAILFDITTSKKFDMAIMLIIGLNMFVMALEHYGQSQEFSMILENLNLIFIAIFTLECLCKIFAMRHFYFREPWNVFDFIVVDLSILGVVMKEYVAKYFVSPTLLRVVRVVKVGRVLRLVKGAKGIRTLLFALAMSLPALFNICLLLFLVMFIYAIFGMSFFMNVRPRAGIDETFNFHTFTSSIIVLFQMSTSAAWDMVLDPLMDEENDCQKPDPALGIEGTCGNKGIAIAYLISYVIVTFLIIINMYIAVILENYSQATEDVQEGLTDDDYEMYYEIWQKFDPDGTQYLPYEKLSDFVDALDDPLRIAKPNDLALVVLDINIYEGNQCYCVDILDALTKFFFTRKGLVIQVNEHLQKVQSILHETPFERITTTYLVKREHYCAKLIQNSWRHWKERTKFNTKENDFNTISENAKLT